MSTTRGGTARTIPFFAMIDAGVKVDFCKGDDWSHLPPIPAHQNIKIGCMLKGRPCWRGCHAAEYAVLVPGKDHLTTATGSRREAPEGLEPTSPLDFGNLVDVVLAPGAHLSGAKLCPLYSCGSCRLPDQPSANSCEVSGLAPVLGPPDEEGTRTLCS